MTDRLSAGHGLDLDLNAQFGAGLSGTQTPGPNVAAGEVAFEGEGEAVGSQEAISDLEVTGEQADRKRPPAARRILNVLAMGSPNFSEIQARKAKTKSLARQQDVDNLLKRFELIKSLSKNASTLRGKEREDYLTAITPTVDTVFPNASEQIKALISSPDRLGGLEDILKSPAVKNLIQTQGVDAIAKFITSKEGLADQDSAADKKYFPEAIRAGKGYIDWLENNNPKKLAKIRSDKKIDVGEFINIHDNIPEAIKMSDEALSNMLQPRNRKRLSDIGITIEDKKSDTDTRKANIEERKLKLQERKQDFEEGGSIPFLGGQTTEAKVAGATDATEPLGTVNPEDIAIAAGPIAAVSKVMSRVFGDFVPGVNPRLSAENRIKTFNKTVEGVFVNNPRFPVAEVNRVLGILPDAESVFTDPEVEVKKLGDMSNFMRNQQRLDSRSLQGPLSKKRRLDIIDNMATREQVLQLIGNPADTDDLNALAQKIVNGSATPEEKKEFARLKGR